MCRAAALCVVCCGVVVEITCTSHTHTARAENNNHDVYNTMSVHDAHSTAVPTADSLHTRKHRKKERKKHKHRELWQFRLVSPCSASVNSVATIECHYCLNHQVEIHAHGCRLRNGDATARHPHRRQGQQTGVIGPNGRTVWRQSQTSRSWGAIDGRGACCDCAAAGPRASSHGATAVARAHAQSRSASHGHSAHSQSPCTSDDRNQTSNNKTKENTRHRDSKATHGDHGMHGNKKEHHHDINAR